MVVEEGGSGMDVGVLGVVGGVGKSTKMDQVQLLYCQDYSVLLEFPKSVKKFLAG